LIIALLEASDPVGSILSECPKWLRRKAPVGATFFASEIREAASSWSKCPAGEFLGRYSKETSVVQFGGTLKVPKLGTLPLNKRFYLKKREN
jgi:hypothetical protein